jgi:hypothetical protein
LVRKKSAIITAKNASPVLSPPLSPEVEEMRKAIGLLNHQIMVQNTKIEILEEQISTVIYMLIQEGFLEQLDKAN